MKFLRPTVAVVHLGNIRKNLREIGKRLGRQCGIMAVVKADAYGHGMEQVTGAIKDHGVAMLGVANADEALALRQAGIKTPVLILSPIFPENAEGVAGKSVAITVGSLDQARSLNRLASRIKKKIPVHIKIDTGMGRFGFRHEDAASVIPALKRLRGLAYEGLCTHFSESDAHDTDYTQWQLDNFMKVKGLFEKAGFHFKFVHAANSGAILQHSKSDFNLARPGILMYGIYPSPETRKTVSVRPAMSLLSKIVMIRKVPAGSYVSYGRTFRAKRAMKIATIPIGYGDGYSRFFSNKGEMLLRGKVAKIVGRVTMDQTLIDVTEVENARVGDEALLFGKRGRYHLPLERIAALIDTIPYELLCTLGKRVPRVYMD